MTGMRPLIPLALIGAASSAVAQVPAAPVPARIIAGPPNPLGDIAARRRAEEERCSDGAPDEVLVCGRRARAGSGYRVPYRPEPGARVRMIAGEPPSAHGAGCLRLCLQPVMIDILDPGSIARGIDRILSGD